MVVAAIILLVVVVGVAEVVAEAVAVAEATTVATSSNFNHHEPRNPDLHWPLVHLKFHTLHVNMS